VPHQYGKVWGTVILAGLNFLFVNLRDFPGDDQQTMQANFLGRVSIFPILFYTIVSLWQVGGAL